MLSNLIPTSIRMVADDRLRVGKKGLSGINTSALVNRVVWAKQLRTRIKTILKSADQLLGDLSSYSSFGDIAAELQDKVERCIWAKKRRAENMKTRLRTSASRLHFGRLMEIEAKDGNMVVNYSEELVELLRDVSSCAASVYNPQTYY